MNGKADRTLLHSSFLILKDVFLFIAQTVFYNSRWERGGGKEMPWSYTWHGENTGRTSTEVFLTDRHQGYRKLPILFLLSTLINELWFFCSLIDNLRNMNHHDWSLNCVYLLVFLWVWVYVNTFKNGDKLQFAQL